MPDEKKIDTNDRDKRYIYTESDIKRIFSYGPKEKTVKKIEKK